MQLSENAIPRVARKAWRCACADENIGYEAKLIYAIGWSARTFKDPAEATAWAESRMGQRASASGDTYESYEITPHRNRNYSSKAADCAGDIAVGDGYIEYLGEAAPYASGTRYCLPCGTATWAIKEEVSE